MTYADEGAGSLPAGMGGDSQGDLRSGTGAVELREPEPHTTQPGGPGFAGDGGPGPNGHSADSQAADSQAGDGQAGDGQAGDGDWPGDGRGASQPRYGQRQALLPEWLRSYGRPESYVTFAVVAACVVFTFLQFDPSYLFLNTTITGGDTGAHVLLPWVAEHQLLPNFRLTGWTSSNWDGFPAITFYFPLPIYSAVGLAQLIGYNVAFKLVTAAPMILMPVASYWMGRLARAPFPVPAVLAVATLPYLFGSEFTIYGGNIFSTLAGEFAYGWSLWFALVFLGFVMRGLQTGRYRAWAAVLFACTFMSHIDPTMFAVVAALVIIIIYIWRERDFWGALWWATPTFVVGGLLAAWWALPFKIRFPYVTNMGYTRNTAFLSTLFPQSAPNDTWLFILAGIGGVLCIARRRRIGELFTIIAVLSAAAFRFMPQGILWNNRVLPFWFLSLYLLAGLGLIEMYTLVVERASRFAATLRAGLLPGPLIVLLIGLIWVGLPLHVLPGEYENSAGQYELLGLKSATPSNVPGWVSWNYTGYEYSCVAGTTSCDSSDIKTRWPEYEEIVTQLEAMSKKYGCGSVMWEYNSSMNDYGTTDALTILPYWTDGCIDSMEGLYYESSATTPFHFINQSELSLSPSDPMVGLPYSSGPNVALGVQHLQMLGVKYYMAINTEMQQQAAADPSLKLIDTFGPFDVNYGSTQPTGTQKQYWKLYLVKGSYRVHALANQPVVMDGLNNAPQPKYLQVMTTYTPAGSTAPALSCNGSPGWYLDPSDWDVYLASSGPSSWQRVPYCDDSDLPVKHEPSSKVTDVVEHNSSISFNVSRTGVPVVVNTSYFPNWQVSGAEGVYRAGPNMMVVVPTSHHVKMWYGYTPVDYEGYGLTILALIGLFFLARRPLAPVAAVRRPGLGEPAPIGLGQTAWGGPALDKWRSYRPGRPPLPGTEEPGVPSGGGFVSLSSEKPMTMRSLDKIFKAYDIRALVPEELDAELARQVGNAFAVFAGSTRVVVGHDMRPSGPELVAAFTEGITDAGVDVVNIGLISTDEIFYASGALDAPGAQFTASHNPARYNGIKLCLAGAKPVGVDTGLGDIRRAIEQGEYKKVPEAERGHISQLDVLEDYAKKVRSFVDQSALAPLKVVADTANGMGGLVVPAVFKGLPFELTMLYPELDGTFPNHPADPIQPANLRDLQAKVLETGADVGLAFDGDADRCFLVDDKAQLVSGSTTTALVAQAMLQKHPGSTILHNLICSKAVSEVIIENGGKPVVTRVGHSYIKGVMAETDALFGGEHSGHYYFRDNYRADSGSIAALVVLEVISKAGKPLSELRVPFERYSQSGEVNTEVKSPAGTVEVIAERYARSAPDAKQSRMDGLTVDFGDWWFNVRPSNTEPLVRLNVEAADRASCDAHTAEVLAIIKEEG